jgi:hypothetical protein
MGLRHLSGCSTLNSNGPAKGWQMNRQLERFRVSPEFEAESTAACAFPIGQEGRHAQPPVHLEDQSLRTPAPTWGREFRTIDSIPLDPELLSPLARNRFQAPLTQ